ncbi:UNVERIFIED_CONTAM: Casparian strip membrane protein 3 [Sesamum radiatum]|uniref:CASP-like protein n=1 Tax=Sesamum radiatum TaxID=300843 RepID=A0AAW2VQE4_SESRA
MVGVEVGAKESGSGQKRSGASRGVAVLDFILRLVAIIATLASAIAMGTTNESLPFFTQFIRFRAKYNDLPTFTFFVVANSIVSAYLVLSLAFSIFHIIRSGGAQKSRVVLIFFDTGMLALLTAGLQQRRRSSTWRTRGTPGPTGLPFANSTIPSVSEFLDR